MTPMILTKAIKPKRINEKAMYDILNRELESISKDILFDFEVTAYTWNHKPEFTRLVSIGPSSVDILVGTDDEIYKYIDEGTKKHFVGPKKKGVLAWRTNYVPKTSPGSMIATGGGASGPFAFDSKGHMVSGIKARKFTKTIQKSWEKKFKSRMEKAMKEAAQSTGDFYAAGSWK